MLNAEIMNGILYSCQSFSSSFTSLSLSRYVEIEYLLEKLQSFHLENVINFDPEKNSKEKKKRKRVVIMGTKKEWQKIIEIVSHYV